jgi:predicted  nucleic acid-binding Zn-ribbon protein
MIDQINNLEGFFRNELKKTRSQLESERDYRTRLETNLKYLEEQVITNSMNFHSFDFQANFGFERCVE